jgi:microcin C transport system substrate-binding protein
MSVRLNTFLAVAFGAALSTASCGGGSSPSGSPPGSSSSTTPTANKTNVSLDKNSYPVFPNADAGADPAVPAEQGGKGFKGDGWETNTDFDLIGDPHALKGGTFREFLLDFPGTLRVFGPETTAFNQDIQQIVYEPLLGLDPTTLRFIPGLATHWQTSADKMDYRFRLNPNARFSDGTPVTADDVVASWVFTMDKGLQEHQVQQMLGKFSKPVAESKYIVRVRSTELAWQNFMNFANFLYVMPARAVQGLDGVRYLKEYNFKLLPGSGPYIIRDEDVDKGRGISVRRRPDYWGQKDRANIGTGNFDEIHWIVVRDQKLQQEMLKKGDADYYYVNVSREWVEDFNFDKVQRGIIQKRKVYTDAPVGIQGIAFNMRREPFNDIRVRKALTLLLNRDLLIQKLFFNEYTPTTSYFPGGVYENPNNPKNAYDPQQALKLLADAGWNNRDSQGRLVRNGRPLAIEYIYADKGSERWLTIYQDDLRKVGITLNLRLISYETLLQLTSQWRFDLASMGWQAGTFPNPEVEWRSTLADVKNSFNITGFKNKRADEIFDLYAKEFDQQKRVTLLRELDGILASEYPYILEWTSGFSRVAYLNKFGHPDYYFSRIRDFRDMASLWWIDPEKERRYQQALADPSVKLEVGPLEVRYWQEYAKRGGGAFVPPTR